MRQRPAFRLLRGGDVTRAELRATELDEVVGVVRLELDAAGPELLGKRRTRRAARLALQLRDLVRARAVHDARRRVTLLCQRDGAAVRREGVEELRICRRKRIDVERSIRIRLTESRWAARLPQEPDCGSDGDVRACSGLRVEAAAREEPPQVGEEVQ